MAKVWQTPNTFDILYRFQHYQCLVVPESAVTFPNFPWEQVSLVIEYEPIKNAIFSNELPNQLKEYIILQTVKETTVNNIDEGTYMYMYMCIWDSKYMYMYMYLGMYMYMFVWGSKIHVHKCIQECISACMYEDLKCM